MRALRLTGLTLTLAAVTIAPITACYHPRDLS